MNLLKKIFFVSGVVIILVSLVGCTATEATDANDAASAIADFDPPAGYEPEFNSSVLGYTVSAYKGPNGPSYLYLIQSEKESDGDELTKCSHNLCLAPATRGRA